MLLAFADNNDTTRIILWVVLACAVLGLITLMVYTMLLARRNKNNQSNNPNAASANGQNGAAVTAPANEVVMSRNVVYAAGADGQLKAGEYVLKNADGSSDKFNLRYNGLVREYTNGDRVVLADGDTLSPVSGTVVATLV